MGTCDQVPHHGGEGTIQSGPSLPQGMAPQFLALPALWPPALSFCLGYKDIEEYTQIGGSAVFSAAHGTLSLSDSGFVDVRPDLTRVPPRVALASGLSLHLSSADLGTLPPLH